MIMNKTANCTGDILLIDDEPEVLESTSQTLSLAGFRVSKFSSAESALKEISPELPGIIITDVKMPKMDGLAFLGHIIAIDGDIPVVLFSGHGDIPMALDALRQGAYDFVEKTMDPDQLIDVVRRAIEKRRLVMENRTLKKQLENSDSLESTIIGNSGPIKKLRQVVTNLAATDVDVLILGQTGTGKELVARCLHQLSPRRSHPFVPLNCGALPETIIENELFGHEAGAFTGANNRRIGKIEYCNGGTLFLDEIESMPINLQVKLLRVLEERVVERLGKNEPVPVDIRVIAASKVDLAEASRKGRFRADLYYRLNVVNVSLPRLSKYPEDIPLLFHHFSNVASKRHNRPTPDIDQATLDLLLLYNWPGNVRELRNCAERFILELPLGLQVEGAFEPEDHQIMDLSSRLERIEKKIIDEELRRTHGQIDKTTHSLGMPRKTLYLRMKKYGLNRKDYH